MKVIYQKKGFTLIEIVLVATVIAFLVALVVPNAMRARQRSQTNTCITNLKQIAGAKTLWAIEGGLVSGDTIDLADIISAYFKETPVCPAGGIYTIGMVGVDPACSVPGHVLPKNE